MYLTVVSSLFTFRLVKSSDRFIELRRINGELCLTEVPYRPVRRSRTFLARFDRLRLISSER